MILHRKYSILFQVILGVVCGLLNGVSNLQPLWKFPLYNDTIITVLASFFGWVSGIVSAFTFHTIVPLIPIFETEGYLVFFFVFCSLSMVAIVQLYQRKKERLLFIDLFILIFIITMVISLEGDFIFTVLYKLFEYQEPIESKKITYLMLQQQIPLLYNACRKPHNNRRGIKV